MWQGKRCQCGEHNAKCLTMDAAMQNLSARMLQSKVFQGGFYIE